MYNNLKLMKQKINIVNRKASYNFEFIKGYTVGLCLLGSEVKAIREGKINLQDSYCIIDNGELFLKNAHISPSKIGNMELYDPNRVRKLLHHKKEIKKLQSELEVKGTTIVPYKIFTNEKNLLKLEIFLARGKKTYDKSKAIKERDIDRDIKRNEL